MTFSINLEHSSGTFTTACEQLSHFGEKGCERIQIATSEIGSVPWTGASPGWIERLLRFFGFKRKHLRLHEVANFSLNWLRAHALNNSEEFQRHLPQIKKLCPLMAKAHLKDDFDSLIASVEEIHATMAKTQQLYVNQRELEKVLLESALHLKALEERTLASRQTQVMLADFELRPPSSIGLQPPLQQALIRVISNFLSHPGTKIQRLKNSKKIVLSRPLVGSFVYEFAIKIDFYLEGAISQRRIIIKTDQVIGKGAERKVLLAYDVLNGEELASKPFSNNIEKMIVQHAHANQLAGFVPVAAVNAKRFYEQKCQPLISCLQASPIQRYHVILQLLAALKVLHTLKVDDISYSIESSGTTTTKKIGEVLVYHGDIKPDNILVFNDKKGFHAALSDLGTACKVTYACYTPFFRSPEKTRFIEEEVYFFGKPSPFMNVEKHVIHNLKYGQASDVWSLGIVLLTILSAGRTLPGFNAKNGIPDLDCFKKGIARHHEQMQMKQERRIAPVDSEVKDLAQGELDQSIDKLKEVSPSASELEPVWTLVKLMLKVDPEERVTAVQALQGLAKVQGHIN